MPLKNKQNKGLNDNEGRKYCRMLPLEYFWPPLSDNWSCKPIFVLFESGGILQYFGMNEDNLKDKYQNWHSYSLIKVFTMQAI